MGHFHENAHLRVVAALRRGELLDQATAAPTKRGPPAFSFAVVNLKRSWGTLMIGTLILVNDQRHQGR